MRAVGLPDLRRSSRAGSAGCTRCSPVPSSTAATCRRRWLGRRGEATLEELLPLAQAWTLHARALLTLAEGDAGAAAEQALEAANHADAVRAVAAARCRTLAGVALAARVGATRPSATFSALKPNSRRSAPSPLSATRPRASCAGSPSA